MKSRRFPYCVGLTLLELYHVSVHRPMLWLGGFSNWFAICQLVWPERQKILPMRHWVSRALTGIKKSKGFYLYEFSLNALDGFTAYAPLRLKLKILTSRHCFRLFFNYPVKWSDRKTSLVYLTRDVLPQGLRLLHGMPPGRSGRWVSVPTGSLAQAVWHV